MAIHAVYDIVCDFASEIKYMIFYTIKYLCIYFKYSLRVQYDPCSVSDRHLIKSAQAVRRMIPFLWKRRFGRV
jgi:hypothetical protein